MESGRNRAAECWWREAWWEEWKGSGRSGKRKARLREGEVVGMKEICGRLVPEGSKVKERLSRLMNNCEDG